ncbi:MAG: hypothetical protein R2849_13825 [Thermomicrobiales bacterium]
MYRSFVLILISLSLLATAGISGRSPHPISDEEAVELLYAISEERGQPALDAMARIRAGMTNASSPSSSRRSG